MAKPKAMPLSLVKSALAEFWAENPNEAKPYHVIRNYLTSRFKGVSERTVFRVLNQLVKEGVLQKNVEPTHRTWYKPTNSLTPALFSVYSFWHALGYKPRPVSTRENEPKALLLEAEKKFSLEDMLVRVLIRSLYGLLKTLETGNREWYEYTKNPLTLNPFMLTFFGLNLNKVVGQTSKHAKTGGLELYTITTWELNLTQEEINEIKRKIQETFPEEWRQLDMLYEAALKAVGLLTKQEAA